MERWARSRVAFLIVAVLASGCYLNALGGDFVSDDHVDIEHNRLLQETYRLPDVFTSPLRVRGNRKGLYRPITALTYWIDLRLFGPNPLGFHLENLLWHTATALVVLVLLRRLWPNEPLMALMGAALFAVHPVHTEAVAWVTGRSEILAAFWGLLAFLAHRRADIEESPISLWRIAALAAWLVALGAKEMAATVPLLLLMSDAMVGGPSGWWRPGRIAIRYGPYAALAVAYLVVRSSVLGHFQTLELYRAFHGAPLSVRGPTMLKVGAAYVGRLLFPVNLNAEWIFPKAQGLTDGPLPLLALALLAALVGLAWAVRRTAQPVAWGILWSGLALLPVSNLVPIGEMGAERFLYFSSVGACSALAWVIIRGFQHFKEAVPRAHTTLPGALGCAALILFSANTIKRNRDWSDDLVLLEKTVRQSPRSVRVNRNLGKLLQRKGRYAEAEHFLKRGVEIMEGTLGPDHPKVATSLNNLAWHYTKRGQYAKAEPLLIRALAIAEKTLGPDHTNVAIMLNNLASAHFKQGNYTKAEHLIKRALEIREGTLRPDDPYIAKTLEDLARLYEETGRIDEAKRMLERARRIRAKQ